MDERREEIIKPIRQAEPTEYDPKELTEVLSMYIRIGEKLIEKDLKISLMESCTGGFIASLLSNTEGISSEFSNSFVTYSNESKIDLGVDAGIIAQYGVYSKQAARAMADIVRKKLNCDIGVGVTGCLGRVDPENPLGIPGQVYFAVAFRDRVFDGFVLLKPGQSRFQDRIDTAAEIGTTLLKILEEYDENDHS